jgi:hypothetical protein
MLKTMCKVKRLGQIKKIISPKNQVFLSFPSHPILIIPPFYSVPIRESFLQILIPPAPPSTQYKLFSGLLLSSVTKFGTTDVRRFPSFYPGGDVAGG